MRGNLDQDIAVSDVASRAAMSPRTFARRFLAVTGTTPHQWLLAERTGLAQQLLETTDLAIDTVAARCGLGNATNLRKRFHQRVGTSPSAYRAAFRDPAQHAG